MQRPGVAVWLAVGWVGFAVLPWNAIGGQGFFAFNWLAAYPLDVRVAPGRRSARLPRRAWLLPLVGDARAAAVHVTRRSRAIMWRRGSSSSAGALGVATIAAVALAIDIGGWTWPALAALFGALPRASARAWLRRARGAPPPSLMFVCHGLALRGWVKGDAFVAGAIGASVALVGAVHAVPAVAPVRARVRRSRRATRRCGADRAYRIEQDLGLRRRGVEHAAARADDGDCRDAARAVRSRSS